METHLALINEDNKIVNIVYVLERDNQELYNAILEANGASAYVDLTIYPYPFDLNAAWDNINKIWVSQVSE